MSLIFQNNSIHNFSFENEIKYCQFFGHTPIKIENLKISNQDENEKKYSVLLNEAIKKNEYNLYEFFLKKKANPNYLIGGETIFEYLMDRKPTKEKIALFISFKADLNFSPKSDMNALHFACMKKMDTSIIDFLISEKLDVNSLSRDMKEIPLHLATYHFVPKVIDHLLSLGANINAKNRMGYTPLHIACGTDKRSIPFLISKEGIDVNLKNNGDFSPLEHLCDRNPQDLDGEMIKKLIEFEKTDLKNFKMKIEYNSERYPLLFWIISIHSKLSLSYNKDYNKKAPIFFEIFKYLLSREELEWRDSKADEQSCLHFSATRYPSIEMIELMIEKGMDVNQKKEDRSVLLGSIIKKNTHLFFILLLNGAILDEKSSIQMGKERKLVKDLKRRILWNKEKHKLFPLSFQKTILNLFLIQKKKMFVYFPKPILFVIVEYLAISLYKNKIKI